MPVGQLCISVHTLLSFKTINTHIETLAFRCILTTKNILPPAYTCITQIQTKGKAAMQWVVKGW